MSPVFADLHAPSTRCRVTDVILGKLFEAYYGQRDLFGEVVQLPWLSNLYESVETLREKSAIPIATVVWWVRCCSPMATA